MLVAMLMTPTGILMFLLGVAMMLVSSTQKDEGIFLIILGVITAQYGLTSNILFMRKNRKG